MSGEAERSADDGDHLCAVCLEAVLPPVLPPVEPGDAPSVESPEMDSATLRCGHQLHLSCLLKCILPRQSTCGSVAPYCNRCPVCRCQLGDKVTSVTSQFEPSFFGIDVSGAERHVMEMKMRIVVLQALLRVKERELIRVAEAARTLEEATTSLGRRLGRLEEQSESDVGAASKRRRESGSGGGDGDADQF